MLITVSFEDTVNTQIHIQYLTAPSDSDNYLTFPGHGTQREQKLKCLEDEKSCSAEMLQSVCQCARHNPEDTFGVGGDFPTHLKYVL